ncbi:MAG: hypothetical protein HFG39_15555 [Lachnospiraceae bacterium]|nr:hypothetical protein [Lachnospiraceae bacterium]
MLDDYKEDYDDDFLDDSYSISAMECTGLMPTPPQTSDEWESYQALYAMQLTSGIDNSKPKDKNP